MSRAALRAWSLIKHRTHGLFKIACCTTGTMLMKAVSFFTESPYLGRKQLDDHTSHMRRASEKVKKRMKMADLKAFVETKLLSKSEKTLEKIGRDEPKVLYGQVLLSLLYIMSIVLYVRIINSLLLPVEHRTSMKSFQAFQSPALPLTSFHELLVLLISSSVVLCHILFGLHLLLYP